MHFCDERWRWWGRPLTDHVLTDKLPLFDPQKAYEREKNPNRTKAGRAPNVVSHKYTVVET